MTSAENVFEFLTEQIESAFCTAIIVPAGCSADIRFTLELGLSVLHSKPLILAVEPGAQVPEKLAMVADEIVELDTKDRKKAEASIHAAVERLLARMGDDN